MGNKIEFLLFMMLLLASIYFLGHYMTAIFQGKPKKYLFLFNWVERFIYKICKIDPNLEMNWKEYAKVMLYFNFFGLITIFLIQILQGWLPLNPQNFPGVEPFLALNTSISYLTITNWQAYAGENTMSYFTQMLGMTAQNFLSASTGIAVLLALIRGINSNSKGLLGNFWVDMTRTIVYLLLPLCLIFSIFLVSQGVIQNFNPYLEIRTMENEIQIIPMGPVASQVAIKQLGTNGGGFFNANSAHPFENPTPLTNFFEALAILLIPAATCYMYGLMVNSRNEGIVILSVALVLWIFGLGISMYSESLINPVLGVNPVLEGKETRFDIMNSVLWAVSTTKTSSGSVNSMLSSLSPLAGGVAMFNVMIGEVVFGGLGVGVCGTVMYIFLAVFLSGLMIGRTPEYLGKKIEKTEMQWAMFGIIAPSSLVLLGAGLTTITPFALKSLGHEGPHGLSEILYAFSSAGGTNGSAFAGFNANTDFYNITLGLIMLMSRLVILIATLAIAGSVGLKTKITPTIGSFSTGTLQFGFILLSVILIMASSTFFPALSLGPVVEHFLMLKGRTF